VIAAQFKEQD
jgi:hypothetical protein